jgi:outer membrane protein assembly factor BamB
LTVLDGQAAMVFGSSDGAVHAWQPRTGQPIWKFNFSLRGLNVSPLVDGNTVYMSQAEENVGNATSMGGIIAIDGSKSGDITKTGELWRTDGMVGKASPLLIDGLLYGFDEGAKLYILVASSGQPIGK